MENQKPTELKNATKTTNATTTTTGDTAEKAVTTETGVGTGPGPGSGDIIGMGDNPAYSDDPSDPRTLTTTKSTMAPEIFGIDEDKLKTFSEDTPSRRSTMTAKDLKHLKGAKRFLGMALTVLASAFFSLALAVVKMFEKDKYPVEIITLWRFTGGIWLPACFLCLFFRYCRQTDICAPISPPCDKEKVKTGVILLFRALAGLTGIMFQCKALEYIQMSDATVITFSTPVFVTFLAWIWLGEKCGVINVIAVVVTIVGVLIITRPPFLTGAEKMDPKMLNGAAWAFSSMISGTIVMLLLRILHGVHFAVTLFFLGFYGVIACAIVCALNSSFTLPETGWEWFYTVSMCACAFGGQVSGTLAFLFEEAGPISLVRSFDVIFSFVWQGIFFKVAPDLISIVGTMIVMSGVLLVGFRKYINSLPDENQCKRKLGILLK